MNMNNQITDGVAFFGYGSLVNELTLSKKYDIQSGKIQNWKREWKHCVDTPFGRICALTVSREENVLIDGVFIRCSELELSQFDEREIGYARIGIARSDVVFSSGFVPDRLYIYTSGPESYRIGDFQYPIWLSYAEVVLYGYLRMFGQPGLDRFIQSTEAWSAPIIDDRKNPKYPRFTKISDEDRKLIETRLHNIPEVKIYYE
jgi:hypothetical protein